jgi:hypothetical protein
LLVVVAIMTTRSSAEKKIRASAGSRLGIASSRAQIMSSSRRPAAAAASHMSVWIPMGSRWKATLGMAWVVLSVRVVSSTVQERWNLRDLLCLTQIVIGQHECFRVRVAL